MIDAMPFDDINEIKAYFSKKTDISSDKIIIDNYIHNTEHPNR